MSERLTFPHAQPLGAPRAPQGRVTPVAARAQRAAALARLGALARWPWPALWVWGAAWACTQAAAAMGLPAASGALLGAVCSLAGALAWPRLGRWRRALLALGYPLALVTLGVSTHGLGLGPVPAWVWLLPLAALLPLYPVQAWRDAPLFPTPRDGLRGLAGVVALPEGARVLDAGCGTGDGLLALARELPRARLEGTERSTPLAALARRRCRGASVRRGDMWADDWHGLDLVYLFQRPETMPRAWAKACAQMAPGRWLVSLEFPVPGQRAAATLAGAGRRSVHVYRVPGPAAAEGAAAAANSTQASASRRSRAARSRR